MSETENIKKKEALFHGIPASPGIAIGTVLLVNPPPGNHEYEQRTIQEDEIEQEITLFQTAMDKTRADIIELQRRVQFSLKGSEAGIFDAHLLIVDDKMLLREVVEQIRKQHVCAEYAFAQVIQRYIVAISTMSDQYMRERADDIKDVASRILSRLKGFERPVLDHLPESSVIIAHDLTPSDTALLDRKNVLAFAIETGSKTSHTAILARSMRIPAVV